MSGILKTIGMVLAGALAVAAVVFTAGAAIPAIGAIVGTGGFSAAVGSTLAAVGLGTDTLLGAVVAGAVTSAGMGGAIGAGVAAITGGNIEKGLEMGALGGAVTGGLMGGIGFDPAAGTSAEIASRGAAGATVTPGAVSVTPFDPSSVTMPTIGGTGGASSGAAGSVSAAGGAGSVASEDAAFAAANAAPSIAPQAASAGTAGTVSTAPSVSVPGNVYTGADGVKYVSNGTSWAPQSSGGFLSNLFSTGPGGYGDVTGKVLAGVGQGLVSGQDATDAAKVGIQRDNAARDATNANYAAPGAADGTSPVNGTNIAGGGGLLRQAQGLTGLPKPAATFNPSGRYEYDPAQRKVVLVPAGSPLSTRTA